MAENSKIEWTTHTFNPWRGCSKVSPGCAHCYAEKQSKRNPSVLGVWGDQGTRVVASESAWKEPLRWDRKAKEAGERHRVFCASMADVFEDRPELHLWRERLFGLIQHCQHLDWLLLTKRPENFARFLPWSLAGASAAAIAWPNVWLGVSVEDQQRADERVPLLLGTPAAVRFLSIEPLLSAVDLTKLWVPDKTGWWNALDGRLTLKATGVDGNPDFWAETVRPIRPAVDWVIVGGESGPGARPMHPDWARSLRDQCQAAGVPFFFKQWGEWLPYDQRAGTEFDAGFYFGIEGAKLDEDKLAAKVGKKAAGRLLDGKEWSEFPTAKGAAHAL